MIATYEAEVAHRFDTLHDRFKPDVAEDDYRLRAVLKVLEPLWGKRILDLGCGKGRFARALEAVGAEVVGIDVSAAMLAQATGLPRVQATARRLPFGARSFDAIVAIEVFQHLDPRSRGLVFDEARRVLRPGGILTIVDKNLAALDAQRPWLPSALVKRIDEYRGRWMYPAGGQVRECWFWPSRLQKELSHQFEDVRIARLLAPREEKRWLFHVLPPARLMTQWLARVPGGNDV